MIWIWCIKRQMMSYFILIISQQDFNFRELSNWWKEFCERFHQLFG